MTKYKNRKNSMSAFSISQVSVPPHLSTWSNASAPAPTNLQPVSEPGLKVVKESGNGQGFDRLGLGKRGGKRPNKFEVTEISSSSSTETESECSSSEEDAMNPIGEVVDGIQDKHKKKSNVRLEKRKSDDKKSSSKFETASEERYSSDSDESDSTTSTKQDANQRTPILNSRRPPISSKEKLKNAVAEKHEENKKLGFKPNVEGNVFNARSPMMATATPAKPASAYKLPKQEKAQNLSKVPATVPIPQLRTKQSDPPPLGSPLRRSSSQPKDAVPIPIPKVESLLPLTPRWPSSKKSAEVCDPTATKSMPQLEKRDGSGHRTFSSSIFVKENKPKPEAAKPDAKVRKTKKKDVQETGKDVVLAEARKQGARLQELSRLRKIQLLELSCPVNSGPSQTKPEDETSDGNEQSNVIDSETGTSAGCGSEKKDGTVKSRTLKDREDEQDSRKSKKRRQTDGSHAHERNAPLDPDSIQKSYNRKRDSESHIDTGDTEISDRKAKKAKNDVQNSTAEEHTAKGSTKEKEKKQIRSVQADSCFTSAKGKLVPLSKQSRDIAHADKFVESPTAGKKASNKNRRQTNQASEADRNSLALIRVSDSSKRPPPTPPSTTLTSDSRDQSAKQSDMNFLMDQFRKLLPQSLLQTTVAKLNSEDRSVCSMRKRLFMRHLKNKGISRSIEWKNADYAMFDDVTLITAAKDLIVLLSETRLGTDLINDQRALRSSANISDMELELGRIAIERQWENEKLQEQVRKLQARIQRLQR